MISEKNKLMNAQLDLKVYLKFTLLLHPEIHFFLVSGESVAGQMRLRWAAVN